MSKKVYTFREFRRVLRHLGFDVIRQSKHEVWRKTQPDGSILRVDLSHKSGEDIGRRLFAAMCRQAGITPREFAQLLDEA